MNRPFDGFFNGGGGIPVGAYVDFHQYTPVDYSYNGARYLRSGYIETDSAKFDATAFAETVGTLYTGQVTMPAATSEDDYVVAAADNGTNTIVAIRGVNSVATQMYVSVDSGVSWQIVSWNIGSTRVNDVIWVASLGLFVAVANAGYIGTSPNGTTWTTRYNVVGDGNVMMVGSSGTGRRTSLILASLVQKLEVVTLNTTRDFTAR